MTSSSSLRLLVIASLCGLSLQVFQLPGEVLENLSLKTTATSPDSCISGGDRGCTSDCPSRTAIPTVFESPLHKLQSTLAECVNTTFDYDSPPPEMNILQGQLHAIPGTDDVCTSFSTSGLNNKFSISLWIRFTCQTCDVLTINVDSIHFLKLEINSERLTHNETAVNWEVPIDEWFLLTIQVSTKLSVFVNKKRLTRFDVAIASNSAITSILGKSVNDTNQIWYTAFNLYNDVLTDRDIELLYTGTLPEDSVIVPKCRCPPDHPEFNYTAKTSEQCTDGSEHVSRFAPDNYFIEFINDGDPETSWISKDVNTSSIRVPLGNVFQVHKIDIILGTSNTPPKLLVKFEKNGMDISQQEFCSSCTMQMNIVNNVFTWEIGNHTQSRTEYENFLADTIILLFIGNSMPYHEVAEVKVGGRCGCYGNANACDVTGEGDSKSATCHCDVGTFTRGNDCSECNPNRYHMEDAFECTQTCSCEEDHIKDRDQMCNQDGGECICKVNVEGTRCTQCKNFTYNLTTDGCKPCACDKNGTLSCNKITGNCECKNYVSNKAVDCEYCSDYYYGRHMENGCQLCDCDKNGTERDSCNEDLNHCKCHEDTGMCDCKVNVEGKKCDTCKPEFWNLSSLPSGCKACECSKLGSNSSICDSISGQCICHENLTTDRICTPQMDSIFPDYGPESGGTIVKLIGRLIGKYGISVEVSYQINGDRKPLDSTSSLTSIVFKMPGVLPGQQNEVPYDVVITKDGKDLTIHQGKFTYKPDPEVQAAPSLKSFYSGGCSVTIKGTHFLSVASPQIISYIGDLEPKMEDCTHSGQDKLVCKTPQMAKEDGNRVRYGLKFDGVTTYRNLTSSFPYAVFEYIDGPSINGDNSQVISFSYLFDKTISITGKGFGEACSKSDYRVELGGKSCSIDSWSNTEIVCLPDMDFPGSDKVETLELKIGSRTIQLGKVEFVILWKSEEFIYICVGIAVFFVLILIICVACCCRRRGRCKCKKSPKKTMTNGDPEMPLVHHQQSMPSIIEPAPLIVQEPDYVEKFFSKIDPGMHRELRSSLIDRKQIEPENTCTLKGEYIRRINGLFKTGTQAHLAGKKLIIKTLKDSFPLEMSSGLYPKWMTDGLADYIRMRDFDDENIMKFYGIAVDSRKFYLLYPMMDNRSLKEHLIDATKELYMGDLVNICLQVVKGMKYLSEQQFVHKDLAARNCMVASNNNIRISDSSYSWDLFSEEYLYDIDRKKWRPVRWMATESLKGGFYDTKSDVWSFGVLMWEVMTRGCLPYQEMERNEAIQSYVLKGFRLGQPENLCDMCFECMLSCWDESSNKRPTFSDLLTNMTQLIETMMAADTENDIGTEGDMYVNVPDKMPEISPPKLPPRSPSSNIYGNIQYDNPSFHM
ncbi:hypothetical protein ScPMuIL_006420 [Solemya velum]